MNPKEETTKPKRIRRMIIFVIVILVSLVLELELILYLIDPWGLKYFDDLATIWQTVVVHPTRGFVLPPGEYKFSHWKATELTNSIRLLPDNRNGSCQVIFFGDSVTWGHGVNDSETWVNLIAGQMPEINAVNAAFDGYNSENVRRGIADFPDAKVIIYMINGNDTERTYGYSNGWPYQPHLSMTEKYVRYFLVVKGQLPGDAAAPTLNEAGLGGETDPNVVRFRSDIEAMSRDKRVLLIGFDNQFDDLKKPFGILSIPFYKDRVSLVDAHPNPKGSREMAAAILPLVRHAVARRCPQAL